MNCEYPPVRTDNQTPEADQPSEELLYSFRYISLR
jgi:hypothetical protein